MPSFTIPENIITLIDAAAIPKPGDDQNTERIVPGRFLKEVTFERMGDYAFFDERYRDKDTCKPVPEHPFNDPRYKGAGILLVNGAGFGSGSSREHAAQAIKRYGAGIQAVLAVSFAEIFAKNCQNIGLVCATAAPDALAEMTDEAMEDPSTRFRVDLEKMTAGAVPAYGGAAHSYPINIPEGRRQAFLTGTWDSLAVIRQFEAGIAAAEQRIPYLKFR